MLSRSAVRICYQDVIEGGVDEESDEDVYLGSASERAKEWGAVWENSGRTTKY